MAKAQKIAHFQNRLVENKLPEARILPGMILSFQYGSPTAYDKRPLFLVLHFSRSDGRIEGMNLNYMKETDIQLFHRECDRIGVDADWEDVLGAGKEYVRLLMNTKFSPSRFDGKVLYKMLFHRNKRYKRAYRRYTLDKITSLKVVTYKLDVLVRLDDEFKNGQVWRLQDDADARGFIWRSKNQKGEPRSFPSDGENSAREWAVSGKDDEEKPKPGQKDEPVKPGQKDETKL
jgi:hypothetical protein